MIVKRIGPLSLAKISGVLYAIIGFLLGCVVALLTLAGVLASDSPGGQTFGALFGAGAVVFLPILYGAIGFLASLLVAAIYNVLAGWVGGVEIEIEQGKPAAGPGMGA